jgi:hypothetical protein
MLERFVKEFGAGRTYVYRLAIVGFRGVMFTLRGSTSAGLRSAATSFENAVGKAMDKGKVQKQALSRLLKEVTNAPSDISFKQFESVKKSGESLRNILVSQKSDKYGAKSNQLKTVLKLVEGKLSEDAREEIQLVKEQRAADIKEQYVQFEKKLKDAYAKVNKKLNRLISRLKTAEQKVGVAVDALPESLKGRARLYAENGLKYNFGKNSPELPSELTPEVITRKIERKFGYETQFESTSHPDLESWMAVGTALEKCETLKEDIDQLKDLLFDKDDMLKVNFDALGTPELTTDQVSLLTQAGLLKANPAK